MTKCIEAHPGADKTAGRGADSCLENEFNDKTGFLGDGSFEFFLKEKHTPTGQGVRARGVVPNDANQFS